MMSIALYPTEWKLPKQEKEDLMLLLGMSAREWETRAYQARERLAQAKEARLRLIESPASESGQAGPRVSFFGRLVAALR